MPFTLPLTKYYCEMHFRSRSTDWTSGSVSSRDVQSWFVHTSPTTTSQTRFWGNFNKINNQLFLSILSFVSRCSHFDVDRDVSSSSGDGVNWLRVTILNQLCLAWVTLKSYDRQNCGPRIPNQIGIFEYL